MVRLSLLTTYMCHLWVCGWEVNTSKNSLSSAPNPLPYPSSLSPAPYKAPNPDSSQLHTLTLTRPSLRNHCLLLAHLFKKKYQARLKHTSKRIPDQRAHKGASSQSSTPWCIDAISPSCPQGLFGSLSSSNKPSEVTLHGL